MAALMWVCHSERPLNAGELCDALGVEIGSSDINRHDIPSIQTVLGCCLGLITVGERGLAVRLIHFTLQEYLCTHPLFTRGHSIMAEISLTYLHFQFVKDLPPGQRTGFSSHTAPFLTYASHHWGAHVRKGSTEFAKSLALQLLRNFDSNISATLLLSKTPYAVREISSKGFTGLHCAALFGLEEIAISLREMEDWDINARDCSGQVPLHWAATYGHLPVTKVLLDWADVDPDAVDCLKRTPLSIATDHGHAPVVEALLARREVNPNIPDLRFGQTPLSRAAEKGEAEMVKLFLKRSDVDPNLPDRKCHQTPLTWAAENGHAAVVQLLLERPDVNPNSIGQKPLTLAARGRHECVVQLLLQRGNIEEGETTVREAEKYLERREIYRLADTCYDEDGTYYDESGIYCYEEEHLC